jgi:signal transduction histidine kinase
MVVSADRNWLEISVTDNGIGIPEEILPKLFKLNGQYSQPGTANEPGTGLGLVLCHEMVEKNGGRIWAESIAGQGTTFIFTIPLSN